MSASAIRSKLEHSSIATGVVATSQDKNKAGKSLQIEAYFD